MKLAKLGFLLLLLGVFIVNGQNWPETERECRFHRRWPVTRRALYVPALRDLAHVLETQLRSYFEYVEVSIRLCPDLRREPYLLANRGFGGNGRLLEVGSARYLRPLVNRSKIYDLGDLVQYAQLESAFVFGPGGGPWPDVGTNGEGFYNFNYNHCQIDQHSQVAIIDNRVPSRHRIVNVSRRSRILALTASLFASSGLQTEIIRIRLRRRRVRSFEFSHGIRQILARHYGLHRTIGLGIIFLIRRGISNVQIQPAFSRRPLESEEAFINWVQYFNMTSPMIGVGTIISNDLGLDLFTPHFHTTSLHEDGGHWRHDVSPETVDYELLINVGEALYRIDKPHTIY